MASPSQMAANAANALHSTGPRTQEGNAAAAHAMGFRPAPEGPQPSPVHLVMDNDAWKAWDVRRPEEAA